MSSYTLRVKWRERRMANIARQFVFTWLEFSLHRYYNFCPLQMSPAISELAPAAMEYIYGKMSAGVGASPSAPSRSASPPANTGEHSCSVR